MRIKFPLCLISVLLGVLFLGGCPKRPPEIIQPEKPAQINPIEKILREFSPVDSFQARTSIRVEVERGGDEVKLLLDGILLFQKPDRLRIIGYHPLGISVFDTLYQNNQLFIFIPIQKKAYEGSVSQFEDMIEKAGDIMITAQKEEDGDLPDQIIIEALDMGIRIWLRLKDKILNPVFHEETFKWSLPEGVEVRSIARFLRKRTR